MPSRIEVRGLRELNRTLNKAADSGLVKAVGRANYRVGVKFMYEWLRPRPDPAAVGRGTGAAVRPSAKKSALTLRVGGAHRKGRTPQMQWGRQPGRLPGVKAPLRPYIKQSAETRRDDIAAEWLTEISRELES